MRYTLLTFCSTILFLFMHQDPLLAQSLAINTDGSAADNSALLDVKSSTKGILVPRTSSVTRLAIINPAKGLMVYDTTTSSFWFFDALSWKEMAISNNVWSILGNAGTDSNANFIGTTDAQPLRFRLNNFWAGEMNPYSGNYLLGDSAGQALNGGLYNTGLGSRALTRLTSGYWNTGLGFGALNSNTSKNSNTGLGAFALYKNTTGQWNTATGVDALFYNTSGYYNTANGVYALFSNTTGDHNTAIGNEAMYANTTGVLNTAVGFGALHSNLASGYNTAIGASAMGLHTNGSLNTAVGQYALGFDTSGNANTAVGTSALSSNTNGNYNTAAGYNSLVNNITGLYNTALGYNAGTNVGTFNNTISIGNTTYLNASSNQAFFGGTSTTWNGGNVTWSTYSDERVKKDIMADVKGIDFINRLRPVTYYRDIHAMTKLTGNKETGDYPGKYDIEKIKFSGFLAQDVVKAAADAGYDFSGVTRPRNEHELYTLSYESFVVPMVKAMQEQQAMIVSLQHELQQVRSQNKSPEVNKTTDMPGLEKKIAALEKRLSGLEK